MIDHSTFLFKTLIVSSKFKGRVTVLYYKWRTFTVKNRLKRNPPKKFPNDTQESLV